MNKKRKGPKFWLVVSLILCLISAAGASLVQSNFGKVTVKDISWETESGVKLNALLLIPDTATRDNPAPAIICSHGWYNNKEMQDLNYIEYARRGFVVMSINMYGHGDSDDLEVNTWWLDEHNANGMYDAVRLMASLPYVDADRIGITGHSNGAQACKVATLLDNEADDELIRAVLLVCNDAIYTLEDTLAGGTGSRRIYDTTNDTFANVFGSRSAGVVAAQYDEFFNSAILEDGYSAPRDYIDQITAQSFLYFGEDPTGKEPRSSYTLYSETIDGREAIRVIYNPNMTHPRAHFSPSVVASSVEFFDAALDAPVKLASSDQIWMFKDALNTLGIVGIFMFIINLALVLVDSRAFGSLKAKEGYVEMLPAPEGAGKKWYWGGIAAGIIFAILTYPTIYKTCNTLRPAFFNQPATFYIAVWTILNGLFAILSMTVTYNCFSKKNGFDLKARGVTISGAKLIKTIILALIVVLAAFAVVFAADWLFETDFRLWVVTIRAFGASKLPIIAKFVVFYLVYYIAISVSVNCFSYVRIGGKDWINTLIHCLAVALGPIIMCLIQYLYFFNTGYLFTEANGFGGPIIGIWLYPIIVYIPVAVLVSRMIYRRTKNPYLGGIIMGIFIATVSCTNTLTYLI